MLMRRHAALVVFTGFCLAGAGCLGDSNPDEAAMQRTDSTARYSGDRAGVAAVLEEWEHAVLEGDIAHICTESFEIRENRGYDDDNGGAAVCEQDPANDPAALIAAAGGVHAYDIVVRRVRIDRRQGDRATAEAWITAGSSREIVSLRRARGEGWAITARAFPAAFGKGREGDCVRELVRQVSLVAPPREANTPRQAVLRSPVGGAREVVRRGGALELAQITYRDDYRHAYALRGPRGGLLRMLPVTVWGSGSYDASSSYFCRGNRIVGIIA